MHRLRSYIIRSFSLLFFSIFLPLFAIASVIFLIKMAHVTSVIQLSVTELIKLYLFILPELLFYTLPIAFFIAGVLSLYKLSTDNEMVVFFALGIKPGYLLRIFFLPALLFTLLLIFNFFFLFPHVKTLSNNFIDYKKSEAKFNLSASEFGHNFGDWLLYIGKEEKKGVYGDVVLFHKAKDEEIFISAKTAEINNNQGVLRLKLTEGEGDSYTADTLSQITFETMYINDILNADLDLYQNALEYWMDPNKRQKKIRKFITHFLFSIFPLISLYMILSIGITHDRHQKGFVYLYLFVSLIVYFGSSGMLHSVMGFYAIPLIITVWLSTSYLFYRQKILARF
ncbi:MAG: permease [Epsilonproteobacteria bacterium]|nr:MAG: permease [Campylobacterota bacterium]